MRRVELRPLLRGRDDSHVAVVPPVDDLRVLFGGTQAEEQTKLDTWMISVIGEDEKNVDDGIGLDSFCGLHHFFFPFFPLLFLPVEIFDIAARTAPATAV